MMGQRPRIGIYLRLSFAFLGYKSARIVGWNLANAENPSVLSSNISNLFKIKKLFENIVVVVV
jgi:hypothetical protein